MSFSSQTITSINTIMIFMKTLSVFHILMFSLCSRITISVGKYVNELDKSYRLPLVRQQPSTVPLQCNSL